MCLQWQWGDLDDATVVNANFEKASSAIQRLALDAELQWHSRIKNTLELC